jgi:ADP-heptose:LPS heptosyltransferase
MTTSFIKSLRNTFPDSQIDILVKPICAPLLNGFKYADNIIPFDAYWTRRKSDVSNEELKTIEEKNYDLIFSMRGDLRENYLSWQLKAKWRIGYAIRGGDFLLTHIAKYPKDIHQTKRDLLLLQEITLNKIEEYPPELFTTSEEVNQFNKLCNDNSIEINNSSIIISPYAASELKQYPTENFLEAAVCLQNNNHNVFLIIPPEKRSERTFIKEKYPSIPLIPEISISELKVCFSLCGCVICNDSGPMHIASAVGTPVIAIFGPTCEEITGPVESTASIMLASDKKYRPRWFPGTPPPDKEKCRESFAHISSSDIVKAVEKLSINKI